MDGAEWKLLRNGKCDLEGNECDGQEGFVCLKYAKKKVKGGMLLCAGWLLKHVWHLYVHRAS